MNLETERLRIIPLSLSQFSLLLQGMDKIETELKLASSNEKLDENTQVAMEGLYEQALKYSNDYLWYTNWQIILKSENKSIGSACFMKKSDENNTVEIGYGINSEYRNKGYATEAIQAMCNWALNQPLVKTVIAETDIENYSSHRVLQKCGMIKCNETTTSIFWTTCV